MNKTVLANQIDVIVSAMEALTPYAASDRAPYNNSFQYVPFVDLDEYGKSHGLFRRFSYKMTDTVNGYFRSANDDGKRNMTTNLAITIIYPFGDDADKMLRYASADMSQVERAITQCGLRVTGCHAIQVANSSIAQVAGANTRNYAAIINLIIDTRETIS